MRHAGKVLGVLGAVGAGTAVVLLQRAYREKSVADAFSALPRLDLRGNLAAYGAARSENVVGRADRRMAEHAHALSIHVLPTDRESSDLFSAPYAAKFGSASPTRVAMSPVAAAMSYEADAYIDEFLDDEVMVIDDSMLDDMIVGDVRYDDSLADESVFDETEAMFHDGDAMTPGGTMFVGAVDEVELSGGFGSGDEPLAYDPEEVPSEHDEINQLRMKMPFG
jgi:hypothetical protein